MRDSASIMSRAESICLVARFHALADVFNDIFGRSPWQEDRADAGLFELRDVVFWNDAAAEQQYVVHPFFAHQFDHAWEDRHMRARQDRKPDDVYVLL